MEQLLQELTAIDARLDALLAADTLTEELRTEHDQLVATRATVQTKITRERERLQREQERQQLQDEIATRQRDLERQNRRTSTRLTTASGRQGEVGLPNIHVRRDVVPRNFLRGTVEERQERAYRFGMFALAMMSQDIGGVYRNRDAESWVEDNLTVHTSNGSTGVHYLIPEEFIADMIDLREQYGVTRRLLNVQPMTSDTLRRPRRKSGLTAYFVAETGAGTESNKTWDSVLLVAKDMMVLARWTANVGMDAVINLGDDLAREITYAFAVKEDDCAFNGDGTSTYGGITGIRKQLGDVGTAGVVNQGTGNTWAALVLGDFHNVVGKLPQFADTPSASWVCHRTFYYSVMQKLLLASGGVQSMEVARGDRAPRPLFLGYPVDMSQSFPSATATSTIPVTLGDYSRAAMFGDRQQEGIAFSNSAVIGGESTFERNELAIRGVQRMDINVHDVGSSSVVGPVVGLKTGS